MVKLSIIVPVYNVEKYLRECIHSILNQKFQDFELILVNDGSTDSSRLICDEYSKKDTRIKVIHKENGGLSSARNAGIDIANGIYLSFVDSDDWINENMYIDMLEKAYTNNANIIVCNVMLMNKEGVEQPYTNIKSDILFTRTEALSELFKNEILLFSACNKIYRRELFHDLRYKEGIILEDMDLAYKLFNKVNQVYYVHIPFYHYRYNDSSILRSEFNLKRLDEYIVRKEMYEFYAKHYPELADLVYYYLCNTGSYLYALVSKSSSFHEQKYSYLIDYNKKILKKLLINRKVKNKMRFKILLFYLAPNMESKLRRFLLKD